jgi:hypothetical protein
MVGSVRTLYTKLTDADGEPVTEPRMDAESE